MAPVTPKALRYWCTAFKVCLKSICVLKAILPRGAGGSNFFFFFLKHTYRHTMQIYEAEVRVVVDNSWQHRLKLLQGFWRPVCRVPRPKLGRHTVGGGKIWRNGGRHSASGDQITSDGRGRQTPKIVDDIIIILLVKKGNGVRYHPGVVLTMHEAEPEPTKKQPIAPSRHLSRVASQSRVI